MAPRANVKAKRGPELWNPKRRNNVTDESPLDDDALPASSGRARPKYPPGPDAVMSVTEEFFNLPSQKSLLNSRCPSIPGAGSSRTVLSEDTIGDAPETVLEENPPSPPGNMDSTPVAGLALDVPDDYVDRWKMKYPNVPVSWGDKLSGEGERAEARPVPRQDWKNDTSEFRQDSIEDQARSPKVMHRRSRGHRRYRSTESDESPHRRRRSHRSRRRRSRRSPSFSTSRSSSDRSERGRGSSRHDEHYSRAGHGRGYKESKRHSHHEPSLMYEEDTCQRRRSSTSSHQPGYDVPSPASRCYEVRNPLSNLQGLEHEVSENDLSERGGRAGVRGICTLNPLTLKKESEDRKARRNRQKEREDSVTRRLAAGKKKYLVHVNEDGRPYGYGVGTFNETIGKLVRGLDPSFIDIRHQPFHLMDTLIARLNEDFNYSDHVNSTWLRGRIGAALSSYKHELIKIIDAKGDRPSWVTAEIWSRLVTMANTEKFKIKSEQMKRANSCRKSKGRTGPIGIAGITEKLRLKLGRTPDPDEIQEEVLRDKSGDRKQRTKSHVLDSEEAPATTVSTSSPHTSGVPDGSAVAANEVRTADLSNEKSHVPVVHAASEATSTENLCATPDSDDPDIVWAEQHPLGKVLVKQMAKLRGLQGCGAPEKEMVLASLMSQIRCMRHISQKAVPSQCDIQAAETVSHPNPSKDPHAPKPTPVTSEEDVPISEYPIPAADKPTSVSANKKTVATTEPDAVATRKSGRISKRKVRDF